MMLLAPEGCGRHGVIGIMQRGLKERASYLCFREEDLVCGRHTDLIAEAVGTVLARYPQTRAFLLAYTCADHILGTDFEPLLRDLERQHGIPFRLAAMNPVVRKGEKAPVQTIQRSVYSFLKPLGEQGKRDRDERGEPLDKRDRGINLLGSFASSKGFNSELAEVLSLAGWGPVRHIADYTSLKDYQQMARSAYNLVISSDASLAAEYLDKELDIPSIYAPLSYHPDGIARFWQLIGEALGFKPETGPHQERLYTRMANCTRLHRGKTMALSGGALSFGLAAFLEECGFSVRYLYTDFPASDETVKLLRDACPQVEICPLTNPCMQKSPPKHPLIYFAYGLPAAWYCASEIIATPQVGEEFCGYHGLECLLDKLEQAEYEHLGFEEAWRTSTPFV
jgi:nitrogenase molybdenum-cofactor synthesis protein NifE